MKTELIAFTDRGFALAEKLATELGGSATRCGAPLGLGEWTASKFHSSCGLVFVGAAGIAVRAIAPFVSSKLSDAAVVVVDENAQFAVPILSGHLGGGNDLARQIAKLCGAQAVITTATDGRGTFAVDEWARHQGCAIANPEKIKTVSAKLLEGTEVHFHTDMSVQGELPEGITYSDAENCDFSLSVSGDGAETLRIVPKIAVIGIGCKKGTSCAAIEKMFRKLLETAGIDERAVTRACSIDLKKDEAGIVEFCAAHSFEYKTFSPQQLENVGGDFSSSAFVRSVTGVDNVCERSAVLGSGGSLYLKKLAGDGVTMALALAPFAPDWRWQNE